MKTRIIQLITSPRSFGLCALLLLTGCSLSRGAPPAQQYVLGEDTAPGVASGGAALAGVRLGIRRVDMASYLASPGILVRRGSQEITSSAFHLWAEPLDEGISRAVAGYLKGAAPFGMVDVAPWPVRAGHDYLLELDVLRFEGVAKEDLAVSGGEVRTVTNWAILRSGDETVLERGTTEQTSAGWSVGDYSALVGMFNEHLQALAVDLTAALARVATERGALTDAP